MEKSSESSNILTEINMSIKNLFNTIDNYNEFCQWIKDRNKNNYLFEKCKKSLNEIETDYFNRFITRLLSFKDEFLLNKKKLISIPTYLGRKCDENQKLNQKYQKLQEENDKLAKNSSLISDINPESKDRLVQENLEKQQEMKNLKNQILELPSNQQKPGEEKDYKTLYLKLYRELDNSLTECSQLKKDNETFQTIINEYEIINNQQNSQYNKYYLKTIEKLKSDINILQTQNQDLSEANGEYKNILENASEQYQELFNENEQNKKAIKQKEQLYQELYHKFESQNVIINNKDQDIQNLSETIAKKDKQIQDDDDKINSLTKTLEEKILLIQHIKDEIQKIKDEIKKIKDEIKKLKEIIISIQNDNEEKNLLIQELLGKIKKLKEIIKSLQKDKEEKEKLILTFEKTKKNLTNIIKGQKEIINKQMILAKNENELQISRIKRLHDIEINAILESFS